MYRYRQLLGFSERGVGRLPHAVLTSSKHQSQSPLFLFHIFKALLSCSVQAGTFKTTHCWSNLVLTAVPKQMG